MAEKGIWVRTGGTSPRLLHLYPGCWKLWNPPWHRCCLPILSTPLMSRYPSAWVTLRPSPFHIYGNHSSPVSSLPRLLESSQRSAQVHAAIGVLSCLNLSRASCSPPLKILASVLSPLRPHLDHHCLPPRCASCLFPLAHSQQPCGPLPLAFFKIFSLSLVY